MAWGDHAESIAFANLLLQMGTKRTKSAPLMRELLFPGRSFGAFLFDMDGTILNSIAATERVWSAWARRHGIDVEAFLPTIHGMRAVETIRRLELANLDIDAEARGLARDEMEDVEGIVAIAGAAAFLAALPTDRWALVTSAPRRLAERRMEAAGIPHPPLMIAGEDVANGKPAPDCFLLAAQKLGQPIGDCLVFEDSHAGIAAGERAGASVVVINVTHRYPMETPHPSVPGYEAFTVRRDENGRLQVWTEELSPGSGPVEG